VFIFIFFFSSRRRHTRSKRDWSSDVCSSDLCYTIVLKRFVDVGICLVIEDLGYAVRTTCTVLIHLLMLKWLHVHQKVHAHHGLCQLAVDSIVGSFVVLASDCPPSFYDSPLS